MMWPTELLQASFLATGKGDRAISGDRRWRASSIGSCLRAQYLKYVEGVPTNPFNKTTLRNFAIGHMVGWYVEKMFHEAGVLVAPEYPGAPEAEVYDDTLNVGGHIDFIVGGKVKDGPFADAVRANLGDELPLCGIELKTKKPESWYWCERKDEPIADEGQRMQAALYRYMRPDIQNWMVLSWNKAFFDEADWSKGAHANWFNDGLLLAETPVTEDDTTRALGVLTRLNAAKHYLDLPCDCLTKWNGKGWEYCPYGIDESTCCDPKALGRVA